MPEVLFTDPALDQFNGLEREIQQRIISKLRTIKGCPEHFLKPLKGVPYFSLRIGDYRAIIDWRKDREELWVVAVGHRKNIYEQDL
jgi:mRNA interferase RelE/StbE